MKALNQLIVAVNTLTHQVQEQHIGLEKLRIFMENCEFCKRQVEPVVASCASHPPNCFPGVQCRDTAAGPRCGSCPYGYNGNGYECVRHKTCRDQPCFQGVLCRDTEYGYECERCPPGFEGNGENCIKQSGCEYNPCHPGKNKITFT